jgi:predicted aspartyl protease
MFRSQSILRSTAELTTEALAIALFAIADSSCAQGPPASPDPANATTLRPPIVVEAEEPKYVAPNTRDRIGRIWAPVTINGKGPFRLVLDTSANSSAVIPSVADRLGITPHPTGRVKLIGVTGTAVVETIEIESMSAGELSFGSSKLPIVADVFGGAEGVLGPKGFSDKRIFIDFRNDLIRIARSNGKAAEPGFTRIPVTTNRNQLLMFYILVGGVKTQAILSTGGPQTLGNSALREALLKRAREGVEADVVGVTLDIVQGQSIAVPPIVLGDLVIRNTRITFADTVIFEQWKLTREPAMLIGMNVIGALDALAIDYKMQELQLRARR